jgi:hypothetical protein
MDDAGDGAGAGGGGVGGALRHQDGWDEHQKNEDGEQRNAT